MHLTQFAPGLKGLQVWDCHENKKDGSTFRNAATGEVLFQVKSSIDVGRCMAADVDPRNPGVEMWSSDSKGVRNIKGEVIRPDLKSFSVNMAVWWDGDLLRELLDKNRITKYDWEDDVCRPLMIFGHSVCLCRGYRLNTVFILSWKIRCIVSVSLLKMWHTTSLPSLVFISDRI